MIEQAEMGLRERKKLETRRRIAETARALFAQRGFEHVTVAEIARAADVSQQTVFNYFPTKEELVFWRLGAFEDELLATVRDRAPGESALAAFRRVLLGVRGLLRSPDPSAREELLAVTRVIVESPLLLAREQQIFADYTAALAALLAEESGAEESGADDELEPWVVANALTGLHRALIRLSRRRLLEGAEHPELGDEVRARADRAFAVLERGLGDYAVKDAES